MFGLNRRKSRVAKIEEISQKYLRVFNFYEPISFWKYKGGKVFK